MAATRLTDSQRIEIVARFRAGEGSAELAEVYGCTAGTVSRVAKAGLDPAEYEQLKQQSYANRHANQKIPDTLLSAKKLEKKSKDI